VSAERTPGPWSRNGFNLSQIIVVRDGPAPDGKTYVDGRHQITVADFQRIEDAEFAVTACNAHDELVAALRDGEQLVAGDLIGADWKIACAAFLDRARAALAKLDAKP